MAILVEQTLNEIKYAGGINTNLPVVFGSTVMFNAPATFNVANVAGHASKAAINSTATATAAQVSTGYITSTSGAATSITFPTGTLLGAQLGATQGSVFRLYVDNTAGANTVTMVVGTNAILSAVAAANAASFGLLTIPAGATGTAEFTLVFSSATAYTITRTS